MKRILATMVVVAGVAAAAVVLTAQETFTGSIIDSLCPASHNLMSQAVEPPLTDPQCTVSCVESGGRYQLRTKDKKILDIANQDFAALKEFAGQMVTMTGEVKSGVITVTKIEAVK